MKPVIYFQLMHHGIPDGPLRELSSKDDFLLWTNYVWRMFASWTCAVSGTVAAFEAIGIDVTHTVTGSFATCDYDNRTRRLNITILDEPDAARMWAAIHKVISP